ncbi:hypothetical protein GCM10008096_16740 [Zhihengliuella salsuginis]|uniref:Uncharacterized protein n=1 Tax=Zhihengliuella salsuginis TaxID=578222 RepID=A0ABQ3GHA3_9MICC|nr:hypothetical protein GCM10008096_16740 [Zhihengliuella salsuginis]
MCRSKVDASPGTGCSGLAAVSLRIVSILRFVWRFPVKQQRGRRTVDETTGTTIPSRKLYVVAAGDAAPVAP